MKKLSLNEMQGIQGGGPACRQQIISGAAALIGVFTGNIVMGVMGAIGFYANMGGCEDERMGRV